MVSGQRYAIKFIYKLLYTICRLVIKIDKHQYSKFSPISRKFTQTNIVNFEPGTPTYNILYKCMIHKCVLMSFVRHEHPRVWMPLTHKRGIGLIIRGRNNAYYRVRNAGKLCAFEGSKGVFKFGRIWRGSSVSCDTCVGSCSWSIWGRIGGLCAEMLCALMMSLALFLVLQCIEKVKVICEKK